MIYVQGRHAGRWTAKRFGVPVRAGPVLIFNASNKGKLLDTASSLRLDSSPT
jgi:hypothetical protein